jgi:DNA-binding MurR/RpiR family transcriptional regulator
VSGEAPIAQRILHEYDALTRSERRLADHILASPGCLHASNAAELSEAVGISKATIARFLQRLGYGGLRAARQSGRTGDSGKPRPSARAAGAAGVRGTLTLASHLASEVQNLVRSTEALPSDLIATAVQALARADKLWVVGFGDNYPLAHFARALLIRVRPDIRMIPIGGFSVPEEFASISSQDALLALGLERRTRALRAVMRSAVRAGARVIYVTNQISPASPEVAEVTLRCRTGGPGMFDSVVAPVSLLTFLCAALAQQIGEPAVGRLKLIEEIHTDWGDVVPGDF